MFAFIIILLFGLLVAFFAGQNTAATTVSMSGYSLPAVPLYVVIVGSMLIGFFVSWVVSIIDAVFNTFVMQKKDTRIRLYQKKIDQLGDKMHDLEMENAKLRGESKEPVVVEKTEEEQKLRPSLFGRFRHSIS